MAATSAACRRTSAAWSWSGGPVASGGPPSGAHVRWAAAARGAGARAGHPAQRAVAGRTAVQSGCQAARGNAAGTAQHPAHDRHHHHSGDARPVRSAGAVGPHRGDEPGPRGTGGGPLPGV
ncbi:hypothetical protein G6F62_014897 [Rhizopus arrhizus]|nr:hypothetical protein G6F62_014897 [Rhizopus arrhizus]